jgi:hypothetical protein
VAQISAALLELANIYAAHGDVPASDPPSAEAEAEAEQQAVSQPTNASRRHSLVPSALGFGR